MPQTVKRIFSILILLVLFSVTFLQPSLAQDSRQQPDEIGATSLPIEYARTPADLLRKAQSIGSIRVIVGLNTRFRPEGELSAAQAQTQRDAVAQTRQSLLQTLAVYPVNVTGNSTRWTIPYLALQTDAAGLQALQASPHVTTIQEDHLNFPTNNIASLNNMHVPPVWANGYEGGDFTVAVIDTGVQATHTFFGGRVVAEYCSSTSDAYFSYFTILPTCPGLGTEQTGVGAANPSRCAQLAIAVVPPEKCDHGTHVAGIAAGNDNDAVNDDGVARGADIIGIQVFSFLDCHLFLSGYCSGAASDRITAFDSDIIAGINHVYGLRTTYQIAAVNMSLGGGKYNSQAFCDSDNLATKAIIDQLRAVNIATIVASGNDFYGTGISAPACISSAVAVGSTSDNGEGSPLHAGKISSFTNTHAMLDLLAPGFQINSSITEPLNTGFASFNGTSMAAPQVAGAWALMRDVMPDASVTQILTALQSTGTPVRDDIRADGFVGSGGLNCGLTVAEPCSGLTFKLINVQAAILTLQPGKPTLIAPLNNVMTPGRPTLTWTALRANQYRLFLDTVNPPVATVLLNTPSYTPPTPLEPKVYYWRVQALNNQGGESELSDVRSFSVDVPAPRNYTEDTTPTLTWNRNSTATKYEVQIATTSTFAVGTIIRNYIELPANSLSFTVPNEDALDPGTYYWRVRAFNGTTFTAYTAAEPITIAP